MKKLKFLLMLLLTMFLFDSTTLKSYAAITDMKETPDEYSMTENKDFYSDMKHLQKVSTSKEDEGRMQKIVIPEYSLFTVSSWSGDVSLYTDSNKNNAIAKKENGFRLYLPKGEYYLCLEKFNDEYENDLGETCVIYYGRVSVNRIMKDTIVKKNKYYDISKNGWGGFGTATAFGASSSQKFEYGTIYSIDTYPQGDKYSRITYEICVKNKNSEPKVTPTGETKKIMKAEGSYDETKDSGKKDKKKPTVKGVKNGKTYKKTVKIKVSDKSGIKKVTLNGKKMKVSKFKKGYKIKKNGKYTLKVWDKANNKRTVKFRIKK